MSRVELNLAMDMWSQFPPELHIYVKVGTNVSQSFLSSSEMSTTFKEQDGIAPSCGKGSLSKDERETLPDFQRRTSL